MITAEYGKNDMNIMLTPRGGGATKRFDQGRNQITDLVLREGEFPVKVQGGMFGTSDFIIYEIERTLSLTIPRISEVGKIITDFVSKYPKPYRESPHTASQKCYLSATTESGGLRVFVDKFAPWQTW